MEGHPQHVHGRQRQSCERRIPHEGGGICVNEAISYPARVVYKCNKIAECIRVIWHTLQAYPDR